MLAVYAVHIILLGTLNGCVYCTHIVNKRYILCIPYSRLFWRALKLANWSNLANMCAAHDPVAHYYARDYASRSCVWRN